MSRLTCSCENNTGYVTIVQKGFMFTCQVFSLKIRWKDVKKMIATTKWHNGRNEPIVLVELLKEISPKPSSSRRDEKKNPFASKKCYTFLSFSDYLATSDNLIRSYSAYKKAKENSTSEVVATSENDVLDTQESEEASPRRSWGKMAFDALDSLKKTATPLREWVRKAQDTVLEMNIFLTLSLSTLIVIYLLIVGWNRLPSLRSDPLRYTQALFEDLDAIRDLLPEVQHSSVGDFYRTEREKREVIGSSEKWVSKLERSAGELARGYAFLQLKISELRQRRANRLLYFEQHSQRAASPSPDAFSRVSVSSGRSSAHSWSSTLYSSDWGSLSSVNYALQRRMGRLSLKRLTYELHKLFGAVISSLQFLVPWRIKQYSKSSAFGGTTGHSVLYEEPFGRNFISEMVTQEDAEERHECLHLVSELIQITELTEEVFSQFMAVLMNQVLDDLATGKYAPHHWSTTPSGVNAEKGRDAIKPREMSLFDADLVLRVIWMRRHVDSFIRTDPLEPNDMRRHQESVEFSRLRQQFITLENHLSAQQRRDESSKETLIQAFYKTIVLRNSTTSVRRGALRNIVDELLFWNANEELWAEFLTQALSKKQGRLKPNMLRYSSHTIQWEDLPVFRGLLCFSGTPRLLWDGSDTADEEPAEEPPHFNGLADDSSNYRLLHVEATAFRKANDDVMERWVTDLELFLDALGDTSPRRRRRGYITPHFSKSPALEIRAKLIQIVKSAKRRGLLWMFRSQNADQESIHSMGSADPSLQAIYTTLLGLPWDNLRDMPYTIINYVILTPPDLIAARASTVFLLWTSITIAVASVIGVIVYKLVLS